MADGLDSVARMNLGDHVDLVWAVGGVFVEEVTTDIGKLLSAGLNLPVGERR